MKSPAETGRPLRADARRNRDALVAAAAEIFRTRGPDVPMLEVAEAAGVGVGTLYRNFPRRESLVAAVFQQGLEEVCNEAGRLLAEHPADEAVELWLRQLVEYVRVNRPLKLVLMRTPEVAGRLPGDPLPPVLARLDALLVSALSGLLDAAARQELIGDKVQPRDLLRMASGLWHIDAEPGEAARVIGMVVDGLRCRRPGASSRPA